MRVLVTGGTGFIGSHMTRRLLADGHQVVVLDRHLAGKGLTEKEIGQLAVAVEGDVTDISTVRSAIRRCERVFHFAALVGVTHYTAEPVRTMQIEERALTSVCAAALAEGCPKIVYASSSAVYGDASGLVDENQTVAPVSNYAVAKRFNEIMLASHWRESGLESVSCRVFNVYGPGQDERLVIPRFVQQGLAGQPLAINGDGSQQRDFPYVGDVVEAMLRCSDMASGCAVLNISTGIGHSIRELAEAVVELTGRRSALEFRPLPDERSVFEVRACIGSTEKLRAETGFVPRTSLLEGLRRTVDFMSART